MSFYQGISSPERAIKHWQSFLKDFTPCHLPGHPDGRKKGFQETRVELDVNERAIQEFGFRHHVTPRSLFQTAWAIVINCYAGVEDVSFGFSMDDEISSSLGDSESILICRTRITPDVPLGQTMANMQANFDDALAHRNYSIAEIQRLLGLGYQPLFNSGLEIQQQGKQIRNLNNYDIHAQVFLGNDACSVSVRSCMSKFSDMQTAGFAHTFGKTLLEALRTHPNCMIGDLDLFSQHDHKIVLDWNKSIPISVSNTFHQHFEDIVQKLPDAQALCSWDGNLTYSELDTLSTKLANHLTDLHVRPETLVLMCFDKSAFAIISMLGIMKAGGAFVAIDPTSPASRLQEILQATHAPIVVTQPKHCHLFDGFVKHVVAIDASLVATLPRAPRAARVPPSPSNTAYVVFTSGSTGAPKGILVEHRALCTAVVALAMPMRINTTTRHLNFAAFTFDLSYGDIFVTLSQGACLCLPSEHERVNDLAGAIVRMNVNSACLIPSVARIFQPEDVPCLKTLSLGGEALLKENLEIWAPHVALNNMYGPSECTIWCCSNTNLAANSPADNIGRGVGALLWIASPTNHDHLCPIGCIGELLIEGPVMARGYIDAEQTQRSFVENPRWATLKSGQRRRYYKTGDLVRYNPDGSVSFVGRKDTQVKFHGRRIEMGEIEYHLASHGNIRQSMAILPAAGVYFQKLVALVVFKARKVSKASANALKLVAGVDKEQSVSEVAKIKDSLSSKLPSYMLPQFWVVVEDIPLMISGKMNRVLAKNFVESLTEASSEETKVNGSTTPGSLDDPVEISLREIWSHVLEKDADKIEAEQGFGSLGGDSFSAMELVARCRAEGFAITVHDCLESVTIRQMATLVQTRVLGTDTNGHGTHEASRMLDNSEGHTKLKLAPVWWDSCPALASPALSGGLPWV